jgi:hypothetical protein
MENNQESDLEIILSNELSEGEKQIKISSYFLFISCQNLMNLSDCKKKKVIELCEYLLRKGIIMADHYSTFPMIKFHFNKNKMKVSDFYCLLANIHTKYFYITLRDFVRVGIELFNVKSKTMESIYNDLNKQQQRKVPKEFDKFF